MGATFIEVPAAVLEAFLAQHGFERTVQYNEVVYRLPLPKHPEVWVKVYTSIRVGASATRAVGKDSIKVCVVFDNGYGKSFGIGKFPHVFRVGTVEGVLARTLEKICEALERGNHWVEEKSHGRDSTLRVS